jgi:hypothetical protein
MIVFQMLDSRIGIRAAHRFCFLGICATNSEMFIILFPKVSSCKLCPSQRRNLEPFLAIAGQQSALNKSPKKIEFDSGRYNCVRDENDSKI